MGRTTLDRIRVKFRAGSYEVAIPHFFEEMVDDNLQWADIDAIVSGGRVRRRFTHDPRGTRYEIVGATTDGRRAAVVCRIKDSGQLLLITTYTSE